MKPPLLLLPCSLLLLPSSPSPYFCPRHHRHLGSHALPLVATGDENSALLHLNIGSEDAPLHLGSGPPRADASTYTVPSSPPVPPSPCPSGCTCSSPPTLQVCCLLLPICTFCSDSRTGSWLFLNVNQKQQRESLYFQLFSTDKSGDMSRHLPGPLPRGPSASGNLPPVNLPPKGLLQQTHPLPFPQTPKKTLLPHHCQFWG